MPATRLLALALPLLAAVPAPRAAAQDPAAKTDAVIAAAMARDRIPGLSLAVVQGGKEMLVKGYGQASLELQVPVTPDTVFPIASVTKVFTATVVMQLVEQQKLALDQTAGELLAGLPEPWRRVRVRQLLSHTSGLPDVIVDPVKGVWLGDTRKDAIAKASALPMQAEPGAAWSYNQTNYLLLGMIVEQLAGAPFDDVADVRLLAPLHLAATTFGDATVVVPRRASWYTRIEFDGGRPKLAKALHPTFVTYPAWMHTAASINTTARELAAFAEAVAGGKLLGEQARAAMWTAAQLDDGTTFRMDGTLGVGLGWLVDDRPGHRAVGGTGGSCVAFRHYLDDHLTVVALTNLQGIDPDALVAEIAACWVPGLAPAPR